MQRSGLCVGWVSVSCVAGISGQRTWVVDPESRAGFDFADLPPAITVVGQ